eukprot:2376568-Rhodomonas_salina.1
MRYRYRASDTLCQYRTLQSGTLSVPDIAYGQCTCSGYRLGPRPQLQGPRSVQAMLVPDIVYASTGHCLASAYASTGHCRASARASTEMRM